MLGISGCSRVELHDPLRKVHSFKHQHLQLPILDVPHLYLHGIWKCIWMYGCIWMTFQVKFFCAFLLFLFFHVLRPNLKTAKGLAWDMKRNGQGGPKSKNSLTRMLNRNIPAWCCFACFLGFLGCLFGHGFTTEWLAGGLCFSGPGAS